MKRARLPSQSPWAWWKISWKQEQCPRQTLACCWQRLLAHNMQNFRVLWLPNNFVGEIWSLSSLVNKYLPVWVLKSSSPEHWKLALREATFSGIARIKISLSDRELWIFRRKSNAFALPGQVLLPRQRKWMNTAFIPFGSSQNTQHTQAVSSIWNCSSGNAHLGSNCGLYSLTSRQILPSVFFYQIFV